MKLSYLNELPATRDMIDVFKGYNHNLRIGDGEFYDMKNLTSQDYPVLSPRPKRGIYASLEKPNGLISKDDLYYVDGEYLYKNKEKIDGFELDPNTTKTLISMGAYIIIMPDEKYINTQNYIDKGAINAKFTSDVEKNGDVYFYFCDKDGNEFVNPLLEEDGSTPVSIYKGSERPYEDLGNIPSGMYWIDTSSSPVLKVYDAQLGIWSIVSTYIMINAKGIGTDFNIGDGVVISNVTVSEIKDIFINPQIIAGKGDNFITVKGMVSEYFLQKDDITVERTKPKTDLVIESGNRLWGCRYGKDNNGNTVNEIYASKLGDFKNWNCFAGISTDSYVASVGTDGDFTGAITYMGYPLFFKENCIHKVYGNYPSNYQIQTTACRGVQKRCHRSLAIVNEVLFYKSRSAICAYDGSLPVEISSALGDVVYDSAVAGALGNKYYVSMREVDSDTGEYYLFVYDTKKGMWHKEDNTQAVVFCNSFGNLYYIDVADDKIKSINRPKSDSDGIEEYDVIKWQAITGIMGTDSPDKKYISRLDVRLSIQAGTRVMIFAEYDSSGSWEHIYSIDGTRLKTVSIPIKAKRCDHLRLRIDGEGEAKIFSICKTIEQGSDM